MSDTIRKGIKIFLVITVVTLLLLLIFTVSEDTWHSLKKMEPVYFIYAFIALAIYYYFDALKIKFLAKALDHDIPVMTGIDIIISGIFLAAVTPFQTGGLPVQIFILKQKDIPYGEGSLLIFMRGVTGFFFYAIALPLIFGLYGHVFSNLIVRNLVRYLLIIYGGGIGLMIFAIFAPDKIIRLLYKIDVFLKRIKLLKSDKVIQIIKWFESEVELFLSGLKLFFTKRKLYIGLSLLLTFISFIFFYSIALIILLGLGIKPSNPIEIINLQFLHAFLVMFMPTPGASGISETLFATLFSSVVGKELLGIYAILWRFLTFYIGAGIGAFITLKIINRSGKSYDEIRQEEEHIEKQD
ncbi:MAG: lysylphosphatidylglycerol synthase transmembrane domain-containing protein [candidate division WOR-3 bacterium]|nr:lysylphosphatidylglycerol synthase transmembrane domain-containing protein [candidate division WOR-3 bacterium]